MYDVNMPFRETIIKSHTISYAMIVKIQMPLSSINTQPRALAYDESREFTQYLKITDSLKSWMGDRIKAFFEVKRVPLGLKIIKEAPWQDW